MEVEATAPAARRVGVNVQKFHRLVARHGIEPALQADGLTGAKFWRSEDVDRLAAIVAAESAGLAS